MVSSAKPMVLTLKNVFLPYFKVPLGYVSSFQNGLNHLSNPNSWIFMPSNVKARTVHFHDFSSFYDLCWMIAMFHLYAYNSVENDPFDLYIGRN